MKELLLALTWFVLGLIIGSALEAAVGMWLAIAILVVVLMLAIAWIVSQGKNEL